MRWLCAGGLLLSASLWAADPSPAARKDYEALQGKWKTVGGEAMGTPFSKEMLPNFTMEIGPGGKAKGRTPQGAFEFTMTLDPSRSPKIFENQHTKGPEEGKKQYGIYNLEGDRFTVCLTRAGAAESDRPQSFETKDTKNVVFIFQRVKEFQKPDRQKPDSQKP